MPIFYKDVVQGTSAWLALRCGRPTASLFSNIVTPTGKPSKSAEPYMLKLLAERCMGMPLAEHVSLWMERGSVMEIDAVRFYELQADTDTEPIGFVTNDAGTIGASPDRLVGDRGLLEIKVPSPGVHMSYLLSRDGAYEAYRVQVQSQMWIAEREWVDVLSYHPRLQEALIRVERDDKFIKIIDELVTKFSADLEELYEVVLQRGWVRPQSEVVADQLARSIQRLPPLDELVRQAQEAGHRP